jgi:hypothetical protein
MFTLKPLSAAVITSALLAPPTMAHVRHIA